MSAASLTRSRARGLDRLALTIGLTLVDWSSARAARRAVRIAAPCSPDDIAQPTARGRHRRTERLARLDDPMSVDTMLLNQRYQHTMFR